MALFSDGQMIIELIAGKPTRYTNYKIVRENRFECLKIVCYWVISSQDTRIEYYAVQRVANRFCHSNGQITAEYNHKIHLLEI